MDPRLGTTELDKTQVSAGAAVGQVLSKSVEGNANL